MSYGKDCGDLLLQYKKSKNMFVQSIIYLKAELKNKKKFVSCSKFCYLCCEE